ncbi:MAG: hypothetical protein RSD67_07670 [Oscillospiraceae bacterium]
MKIKALISFVGVVNMFQGQIKDIPDEEAVKSLISCGYAECVEIKSEKVKTETKKTGK